MSKKKDLQVFCKLNINSNMKYFCSNIDCYETSKYELIPKGQIVEYGADSQFVSACGSTIIPSKSIGPINRFSFGGNELCFFNEFRVKPKRIFLIDNVLFAVGDTITISIGNEVVTQTLTTEIEYESSETYSGYKLIYFSGERRFVVVLKNSRIMIASFYDIQKFDNQKIFVCKLHDMLNHARVFGVKDNKFENYLIYLDDFELKLREEFVPFVFLDCLIAGNIKYCNSLIVNQVSNADMIRKFFPEFDSYISLTNTEHLLINKNTPKGICKFELSNNKISNIIL